MEGKKFRDLYDKVFGEITELSKEKQEKYAHFGALNKILENWEITRKEFVDTYSEVLSSSAPKSNFEELHYQIKYLVDEVGVSCNNILEFYDDKIVSCNVIVDNIIKDLEYLSVISDKEKDRLLKFLNKESEYRFLEIHILDRKKTSNWYTSIMNEEIGPFYVSSEDNHKNNFSELAELLFELSFYKELSGDKKNLHFVYMK